MRNALNYKNHFRLKNDNSIIKISKLTNGGIRHALRLRYAKVGITLTDKIAQHTRYCAFCGEYNNTWFFNYVLSGKEVEITGIGYKREINFCFRLNGTCEGKKLNGNSVEFVSAVNSVDADTAINIIHKRNKTDFYRCNHKTDKDYIVAQGSRCVDKTKEEIDVILTRANYSRSLVGYKDRFGEVDGENRWNAIQELKAITLDNMIRIHGEANGPVIYKEWKRKVAPSLENYTLKYGDAGLDLLRERIKHTLKTKNGGLYAAVTVVDGHVLRSNLERSFYSAIIKHDIPFETDKCYINSLKRCDFYFPKINLYLEIAGLVRGNKLYLDKLQYKIDTFAPLVLYPKDITVESRLLKNIDYILQLHKLQELNETL